jgi:tripartite-type tricarboxylate transporter receptor subunit TctC
MATPAEQERIAAQGGLPLDLTPAQFTAFLEREIQAWGQVIRAGNIRID